MQTSYALLKKYVDITLSPQELGEQLTLKGPEVEGIQIFSPEIKNVVVGKILKKENHPNADKLTVCQVDVGKETLTIVCGAKNHQEQDKVAVALVGATLPGGFAIKKAKLRGVESSGMICSKSELGLEEKSDGVWILNPQYQIGEPLNTYLPEKDYIYHIALTANRSDCLCTLGLAREVALIEDKPLKKPHIQVQEDLSIPKPDIAILDKELCPRYSSRIIKGVQIKESPDWLKEALEKYGVRPINNVVDITNYAMLELGQPMHAFDYHKLEGKKIIVRKANPQEKIKTLDDKEHTLQSSMLVIADEKRAVALAGVMGGANSEVDENTQDLLLEAAYFAPHSVRKTAKALGIKTESSHRFERDMDPENTLFALDFSSMLIVELGGGKVSALTDVKTKNFLLPPILLRKNFIQEILGFDIPAKDIEKILHSLEFSFQKEKENYLVQIPSFRRDCTREIDIVEEIIRAYGYENIPETICSVSMNQEHFNTHMPLENQVKKLLLGMGYHEAYNFSFMNQESVKKFNLFSQDKILTIKNPLNKEFDVLRTGLFASLFQNFISNQDKGHFDVFLFEIGKTFWMENPTNKAITEKKKLGILASGLLKPKNWATPLQKVDFYDVKGVVEELFLALKKGENLAFQRGEIAFLHPGKTALILNNKNPIGFIGEIHPDILIEYQIKESIVYAEIDFEALQEIKSKVVVSQKASRFQWVERELAFIVDKNFEAEELRKIILNSSSLVKSCQVFDVYQGAPVPPDKKSIAFSFILQSFEKTLVDEEIHAIMDSIIKKAEALKAYLREG